MECQVKKTEHFDTFLLLIKVIGPQKVLEALVMCMERVT